MTEFKKYKHKESGEVVVAQLIGDGFILVKASSKNFPNHCIITGAKFYEEI